MAYFKDMVSFYQQSDEDQDEVQRNNNLNS